MGGASHSARYATWGRCLASAIGQKLPLTSRNLLQLSGRWDRTFGTCLIAEAGADRLEDYPFGFSLFFGPIGTLVIYIVYDNAKRAMNRPKT
jgi:hypothetical protein